MLAAIVQQIEHDGRDVADVAAISADLDLDDTQASRSLRRLLRADMLPRRTEMGPGNNAIPGVTERGLREVGAWLDRADQLAAQLIAALAKAAERSRSRRRSPACAPRRPGPPESAVTCSPTCWPRTWLA